MDFPVFHRTPSPASYAEEEAYYCSINACDAWLSFPEALRISPQGQAILQAALDMPGLGAAKKAVAGYLASAMFAEDNWDGMLRFEGLGAERDKIFFYSKAPWDEKTQSFQKGPGLSHSPFEDTMEQTFCSKAAYRLAFRILDGLIDSGQAAAEIIPVRKIAPQPPKSAFCPEDLGLLDSKFPRGQDENDLLWALVTGMDRHSQSQSRQLAVAETIRAEPFFILAGHRNLQGRSAPASSLREALRLCLKLSCAGLGYDPANPLHQAALGSLRASGNPIAAELCAQYGLKARALPEDMAPECARFLLGQDPSDPLAQDFADGFDFCALALGLALTPAGKPNASKESLAQAFDDLARARALAAKGFLPAKNALLGALPDLLHASTLALAQSDPLHPGFSSAKAFAAALADAQAELAPGGARKPGL